MTAKYDREARTAGGNRAPHKMPAKTESPSAICSLETTKEPFADTYEFAVGEEVEVYSNSLEAWQKGVVVEGETSGSLRTAQVSGETSGSLCMDGE